MIRPFIFLTLALVGFSGCTQSVRTTRLVMPVAEVRTTPVDVTAYVEKYRGYDGVILSADHTIEHSGAMDKSGLLSNLLTWDYADVFQEEYVVLNPEADYLTTYKFDFKPDKFYARVVYPAGTIRDFAITDCKEIKNPEGWKSYAIAFPNITVGTIVKIGYESEYVAGLFMPPLEYDIDLQYSIPCEKLKFTFAYPDWWTIQQKRLSTLRFTPVAVSQKPEAKKTYLTYEATDVPALRMEPFSPPFKLFANYLEFQVTHLKMIDRSWDNEKTWAEVAETFHKYVIKKAERTSSSVERVTDSLVRPFTTPRGKAEAILKFVADRITPSWRDNDGNPGKTLDSKVGSPYDIASLTRAMLERAGMESEYLIVHDSRDGYFDGDYITGSQFGMPALRVQLDSAAVVLFPTFKYLPFGMIPEDFQGQPTLTVGGPTAGKTWTVPVQPEKSGTQIAEIIIAVDSSGTLKVDDRRTLDGIAGYDERRNLAEQHADTRDKFIRRWIEIPGLDVSIDSVSILNDSAANEPLVIDYQYTLNNLVTITPSEMLIQSAGLFGFMGSRALSDDVAGRTNDVYIPRTARLERNVTFELPEGWLLSSIPDSVHIENEFGSGVSTCQVEPGKVTFHQVVDLYRIQLGKEKYADLLALVGKDSPIAIPTLVLTRVTQ